MVVKVSRSLVKDLMFTWMSAMPLKLMSTAIGLNACCNLNEQYGA